MHFNLLYNRTRLLEGNCATNLSVINKYHAQLSFEKIVSSLPFSYLPNVR